MKSEEVDVTVTNVQIVINHHYTHWLLSFKSVDYDDEQTWVHRDSWLIV